MGELSDEDGPGTSVGVFSADKLAQANQAGHSNHPASELPGSAVFQLPAALSRTASGWHSPDSTSQYCKQQV